MGRDRLHEGVAYGALFINILVSSWDIYRDGGRWEGMSIETYHEFTLGGVLGGCSQGWPTLFLFN